MGERNIPISVKRQIWAMPCVICGAVGFTEVDHVIPVARGGKRDRANLQPLCWQCNAHKSDRFTNVELKAWFSSREEEHRLRHRHRVDVQFIQSFDRPSFESWLRIKGVSIG